MLPSMDVEESRHFTAIAWRVLGMLQAPFSEEEGHCGSVECLARSAQSQVVSCMHETCGGLYQTRASGGVELKVG
jgi:hypothetical protein